MPREAGDSHFKNGPCLYEGEGLKGNHFPVALPFRSAVVYLGKPEDVLSTPLARRSSSTEKTSSQSRLGLATMNILKRVFSQIMGHPTSSGACGIAPVGEDPSEVGARNVIELPIPLPPQLAQVASLDGAPSVGGRFRRLPGLLDSPEIVAFQKQNFFGLGRHNGANYRSQEAFEEGRKGIISAFQKALENMIAKRTSALFRFRDTLLATEGLSKTTEKRLQHACERTTLDIEMLNAQLEAAESGKGWVLEALNRYQIGFQKGLQEAVEFELSMATEGGFDHD
jgi:hypothetical protein